MVPEDGSTWGYPSAARFTDAEAWVKKKLALGEEMREELALRYLAAFGPASVADMQTWSGLAGLKVELESLREQGKLAVFSDESGRELFDLPQAPRPGAEVDAPVRFLPDFDNLVLAHADRSRLVEKEHLKKIVTKNLQILPTFLVGGLVAGMWKLEAKKSAAKLSLSPFAGRAKLSKQVRAELEEEGERLLTFVEPDVKKKELAWAS
jgi:hypothetical protein